MLFLRVFQRLQFHFICEQIRFDLTHRESFSIFVATLTTAAALWLLANNNNKKLATCKLLFVIKRYNNCCSILYTFFSVFSKMFTPPEQQRPFTVTVTTQKGCRHGGAFEERAQSCGGTLWSNIRGWGCMGAGLRYKEHFMCFLLLLLL